MLYFDRFFSHNNTLDISGLISGRAVPREVGDTLQVSINWQIYCWVRNFWKVRAFIILLIWYFWICCWVGNFWKMRTSFIMLISFYQLAIRSLIPPQINTLGTALISGTLYNNDVCMYVCTILYYIHIIIDLLLLNYNIIHNILE